MTSWDHKMRNQWLGLKLPSFYLKKGKDDKEKRTLCVWSPPIENWTKLNFEGASRVNPRAVGISCCIKNYQGELIAKCMKPIGKATNNEVELRSLFEGLWK